jgi:hypothetical protein
MPENDLATRAAALLERANADPPTTWKLRDRVSCHPQAIAGEVVEKSTKAGAGYNGETITTVTIRSPDGFGWCVWVSPRSSAGSGRVEPGDVVAVADLGHREGKGNGYELCRVVVDRSGFARLSAGVDTVTAVSDSTGITAAIRCEVCGLEESEHAPGSPDEIPF